MSLRAGPKSAITADPLDLTQLPKKLDYRRIDRFARDYLIVPRGTGALTPFRFRPWQRDEVVKLMYPPTGRRPRQGLVSMPRGNGKSGLAAALAVYGLLADEEEGAEVLVVASDERQARIVYGAARRMIELNPALSEQVQIYQDRIYVPATDSVLMPLPAEPNALQGWNPTLTIVDELHVVTEPVWEAMSLASGKRAESLTLAISTPSDRTDSVMWRLVEYGRQNPDDRSFRLVEYATPDTYEADDREGWKIGNPALGDFLHEDAIAATYQTTNEASFRRYRLGQWVGSADSWLPWGIWDDLPTEAGLPDKGTPIVLSFDGSASGDSTTLIGCTIPADDDEIPRLFVVGIWEAPENDQRWRVPRHEVTGTVATAFDTWDVRELAADPWGWRSELEEWQATHGGRVVEWNTAHAGRMAPATDRLYAATAAKRVAHDGNDDLARHIANTRARSTPMGDIVSKDKRRSSRKIDAAVAAIVAHDRAVWHFRNPPKRRRVVSF